MTSACNPDLQPKTQEESVSVFLRIHQNMDHITRAQAARALLCLVSGHHLDGKLEEVNSCAPAAWPVLVHLCQGL